MRTYPAYEIILKAIEIMDNVRSGYNPTFTPEFQRRDYGRYCTAREKNLPVTTAIAGVDDEQVEGGVARSSHCLRPDIANAVSSSDFRSHLNRKVEFRYFSELFSRIVQNGQNTVERKKCNGLFEGKFEASVDAVRHRNRNRWVL